MKETSEKCQLIVTTHSEVIVDALTDTPDSVLVCEKSEEGTTLTRLDSERLKPWLKKYRLGCFGLEAISEGIVGESRLLLFIRSI
jgi:predicted ATPase